MFLPHIKNKKHKTLRDVGYFYYFDCGDDNTIIFICLNLSNCMWEICAILCKSILPQ